MGSPLPQSEELHRLLTVLSDGEPSGAEFDRLQQLLRQDPAAQAYYRQYMRLCALLEFERAASGNEGRGPGTSVPSEALSGQWSVVGKSEIGNQEPELPTPEPLIAPIIVDSSAAVHDPLFSIRSPLGGWLLSYAAATVITGMAILGAWLHKVSLDSHIAQEQPLLVRRGDEPRPEYVGRITGMADCEWADRRTTPPSSAAAVPVGGKYALSSGLMEITYHTGAKVILQGPCTYEVDSARGGFLSLGKLTARVETKGEGGRGKAEEGDVGAAVELPHQPVREIPLPPASFPLCR